MTKNPTATFHIFAKDQDASRVEDGSIGRCSTAYLGHSLFVGGCLLMADSTRSNRPSESCP